MTDPSEFGDEAGIRPEVTEALLRALKEEDSAKLAELEAGITPDERKRAQFLLLATAIESRLDREIEALDVLRAQHWPPGSTWAELFDDLTPERAARLGELYDALPDSARAEYDRRYGRPEGT